MFEENMKTIIDTFYEFRGSGMYLALFFIAMLYLYFKEDNEKIKNLLLYFPIAILLITLNPIFNEIPGFFPPINPWIYEQLLLIAGMRQNLYSIAFSKS